MCVELLGGFCSFVPNNIIYHAMNAVIKLCEPHKICPIIASCPKRNVKLANDFIGLTIMTNKISVNDKCSICTTSVDDIKKTIETEKAVSVPETNEFVKLINIQSLLYRKRLKPNLLNYVTVFSLLKRISLVVANS